MAAARGLELLQWVCECRFLLRYSCVLQPHRMISLQHGHREGMRHLALAGAQEQRRNRAEKSLNGRQGTILGRTAPLLWDGRQPARQELGRDFNDLGGCLPFLFLADAPFGGGMYVYEQHY